MTTREPATASILAARIQRAYPSLSPYRAASLAEELCRIERAQHRHAERCCSGEDGGYVTKTPLAMYERTSGAELCCVRHNPDAEERAGKRVDNAIIRWQMAVAKLSDTAAVDRPFVELHGDPRGCTLKVRFPGEAEATWS